MQNEIQQSKTTSTNFVKGNFKSKLQRFHMRVMGKVLVVLAPFLAFSSTYNSNKAHYMLALMSDPWFKSLDVVTNQNSLDGGKI
jgi:succinate dehydrogenase hydrophobic anchor subunit